MVSRGRVSAFPEERGHDDPRPLDGEHLSHEEFTATRHDFEPETVVYSDGGEREVSNVRRVIALRRSAHPMSARYAGLPMMRRPQRRVERLSVRPLK